jgi:hypothetical protein
VRPWDVRVNFRQGVVPRMALLQKAFAERQFEVEVRRTLPLSLALTRRGTEPIARSLVAVLETLAADRSLAA